MNNIEMNPTDKLTTVYKKLLMSLDQSFAELEVLMDYHIKPKVSVPGTNGKLEMIKDKDLWFDPIIIRCPKCDDEHGISLNDRIREKRRRMYQKFDGLQSHSDYRFMVERKIEKIIGMQKMLNNSIRLLAIDLEKKEDYWNL